MGKGHSKVEKALGETAIPEEERFFGFENFGNTCYANSVLQALYYCPAFRHAVMSHPSTPGEDNLLTTLADLFETISFNKRKTGTLAPRKFCLRLKREHAVFNTTQQQDAQEFLNFLLNTIAEIARNPAGRKPEDALACSAGPTAGAERTWVHEIFEGTMATETRCLCCETVRTREESFLDLSVDIQQNSSISSCLRSFSKSEVLRGDCKYYCETCCSPQEAERSMRIRRLPQVLALHLKRFNLQLTKLSYRVVFPAELRLFNTTSDAEQSDRIYDLFAIVVHVGSQPNSGHYITLANSYGVWILFDDDDVQVVDESYISAFYGLTDDQLAHTHSSESAYILFYQARDAPRPPRIARPPRKGGKGEAAEARDGEQQGNGHHDIEL